jgi:hypothetical protein
MRAGRKLPGNAVGNVKRDFGRGRDEGAGPELGDLTQARHTFRKSRNLLPAMAQVMDD